MIKLHGSRNQIDVGKSPQESKLIVLEILRKKKKERTMKIKTTAGLGGLSG